MSRRSAPVKNRDVVDVRIERLAQGGRGVARHDGFVLFVQRALPGDLVRARVTKVRKAFAEATALEVLEPGPDRIEPPCPYVGTCGGCAWQPLDYPMQARVKEELVLDSIQRIGGATEFEWQPIVPATDTFGYRNKVEYTFVASPQAGVSTADIQAGGVFDDDGKFQPLPTDVGLGFHKAGRWDEIVAVDQCLIADPRGRIVHDVVVRWANDNNVSVHDRATGKGVLRNLVVRVARNTGEVLAHIVTAKGKMPRLAELVDELQVQVPGLVGVLRSINTGTAEVASGDAGSEPEVLYGRDYMEETIAGERLRVNSASFLQTNTQMAEALYELVAEYAELRSDDIAYDLYCGIGSITLMLARHVREVVGVEVVPEAIECARENAAANGIDNVDFQVGNVRPVLKFANGVWPDPTLIVVDPPRSGLVEKVVRRVCEAKPERIIYVSCNPTTFAGNLPWFRENGYDLVKARAVDQFPHTPHVELVARLEPIAGWVAPEQPEDDEHVKKSKAKFAAKHAAAKAAAAKQGLTNN